MAVSVPTADTVVPARGRDRREHVVTTAATLFAERGFHGTSMRDLAQACGLRASSLYNHVRDKNDLLVRIVSPYLAAVGSELTAAADKGGDGATRVSAMLHAALRVAREHRNGFLSLSNSWTHIRDTPELAGLLRSGEDDRRMWTDALRTGIADGSLQPDLHVDGTLRVVFSAIHGSLDSRYDAVAPPPDAEQAAKTVVGLLLNGMRNSERR
ncbi:TetR/AcrR family transcriptional regulator [Yinghuangia sp. YIM S09857]|uniref:TetR/AcrR family transcriptional regulator n=1 Tax=Yinghuangia sp. YIM S09857 TaxID=3436929 RepID=UPI003F535A13